jgi:CelD/BcsL family acetyltransferase involved in cellulose biosynthesis
LYSSEPFEDPRLARVDCAATPGSLDTVDSERPGLERPVFRIDPLLDPRWTAFVSERSDSSVFHTAGWLKALQLTYKYEPVVFTTAPPGRELTNGIVCCAIDSWLTGRRLVSLPFSDHCQPLLSATTELKVLSDAVRSDLDSRRRRYIELRPSSERLALASEAGLVPCQTAYLHRLDLRPGIETLRDGFHASCVRRRIQRAERESLTYQEGSSDALLSQFYELLVLTRRRRRVPPQPFRWFQNLRSCLGSALKVRVVSKDRRAIASIITLSHKSTLTYKYGGSDPAFNHLAGTVLLFWRAILDGKTSGATEFDLGRTDATNTGLLTFKDHWGARRTTVTYYRYPTDHVRLGWGGVRGTAIAKRLVAAVPDLVLIGAGKFLYRHVG